MILLSLLLFTNSQINSIKNQIDSAIYYEEIKEVDRAFELYQSSLKSAQESKSDSLEAIILIRLGTILGKSGNFDESEKKFRKAFEISSSNQFTALLGKALLGLGNLRYFNNKLDSAVIFYTLSIPHLFDAKDSTNANGAINNIAVILRKNSNIPESIKLLHDILDSSNNLNNSIKAGLFRNLGLAFIKTEDIEEARKMFETSLALAKSIYSEKDQLFALSGLAKVSLLANQKNLALKYYTQFDSVFEKYLHHDYSDKILELETKYRTAEIERDNAIKQVQIEVQEQRMIYLYIIAALLLFGIIGIYLYSEQRKKVIRALATQKNKENEQRINDLLNDQELKSAYAMLAGQEKAHKRIAQELHDNLGSILVTLNMFADSLQNKKDPEALKQLAVRISEVAQQANETTRQISHSLDSGVLKHFGLEIAVKELMNALDESGSITVENHIQITSQLDSELSMNIYRIIQELVNNTLKHSKASKITLELNQIKDHLSLIYYDNGVGFIKEEIEPGMGLKNLESRVDSSDGTITIDSQPGKGTTTIIDVPVA